MGKKGEGKNVTPKDNPRGGHRIVPPNEAKSPKKKKQPKVEQFYTEKRNNTGAVYRSYPKTKSVRKAVPEPIFPDVEERISSKQVGTVP